MSEEKIAELRQCAESWDPEARLIGNVTASEIVAIVDEVRRLREQLDKAACTWCGHVGLKSEIADHIIDCVKHPIGELLNTASQALDERDAAKAALAEAESKIKFLQGAVARREAESDRESAALAEAISLLRLWNEQEVPIAVETTAFLAKHG